jgi:phage terminase large subunit
MPAGNEIDTPKPKRARQTKKKAVQRSLAADCVGILSRAVNNPVDNSTGELEAPAGLRPYPWQQRVLDAFERGVKRFMLVVHRRAGKDQVGLELGKLGALARKGQYAHVFPYQNQVRRAIWNGMDKTNGQRFIDRAFPDEIRAATRHTAMELELVNGSLWACLGSDNREAMRGSNALGYVFSEFAFCHPDAWPVISPILRENDGWAAFITTPNGKNHAFALYQAARNNPSWHVEYLTVNDTADWDGKPLIGPEAIEAERADGMDEGDIQREYFCSWEAAAKGAYFTAELGAMTEQQRARAVDYVPGRPVFVAWHIGKGDRITAAAFQTLGAAHYCIGSRAWEFASIPQALAELEAAAPFRLHSAQHILPAALPAVHKFLQHGLNPVTVPDLGAGDMVEAIRSLFPTLWLDVGVRPWAPEGNNGQLMSALAEFKSAVTEDGGTKGEPLNNWAIPWIRALGNYATAAELGMLIPGGWGPRPSTTNADRMVI